MLTKAFNQGCIVAKRLYVHESIYDEFVEGLVAAAKALKVGPGSDTGVMLGPIQNEMQYNVVKDFINDSIACGHKFALGGPVTESSGYFVQPTIIDNPPDASRIITGEPFGENRSETPLVVHLLILLYLGPVVPVQPWVDEDEIIRRANSMDTGLGGSVWSKDLVRAERIARQLQTGTVWVNSIADVDPRAVFSGHKTSGLGGEYGMHALDSYTNTQSLFMYK